MLGDTCNERTAINDSRKTANSHYQIDMYIVISKGQTIPEIRVMTTLHNQRQFRFVLAILNRERHNLIAQSPESQSQQTDEFGPLEAYSIQLQNLLGR